MTMASRPTSTDKAARWAAILDHLAQHGRLEVADAAELLGVSEATIRRDFTELSERQLVTRKHGGIVATSVAYELPYRYRSSMHDSAKLDIAKAAAALVKPGDVVGVNGGTTTTALAREITSRSDLVGDLAGELTLVTNALNIASEAVLRPHVQCVSLGGIAQPGSYEVTGPLAALVLDQLWIDIAILGVNGITASEGATCRHEAEAAICSHMARRSSQVVVVATGDKVGARTFAAIRPANEIDVLVTDRTAPAPALERLRDAGLEILQV